MSTIKKVMISLIVSLLAILGIYTTSNAYYVGQQLGVSYKQYATDPNIYCAEHGQALRRNNSYRIISNVKIEGNKSTDHTGKSRISNSNARLAYILSADNGPSKSSGPVSNALWNYLYTWLQEGGKEHAGLYGSFSNGKPGVHTWLDDKAAEYANNFKDTTKITDNTDKSKIKVVPSQKDGKPYMRVGPFNWTFPGTMKSVTANDQDGKEISGILYSSFNGNTENWFGANGIKSGSDFYISVPMNTNITKITKITGNTTAIFKGVNIWFLESTNGYKQNLLIREPYEVPANITTSFDYNISTQGNLKVVKINKNNEEVKLSGVGFYIQHKETGKYVHKDANGKISYVEKEQATEFVTDKKGEILIKNLIAGTYLAYETKNPNYGYEMLEDAQQKIVISGQTNELIIGNKQIYVKLSGYVWVDKISGKRAERNDLYNDGDYDYNDILLDGVTVRLKDRTTGEIIKEAKTAEGGAYLFMDVLIEKLKDYYIEFEYDGLTYTNVVPHIDKNNGSKSAESEEVRNAFNQNFSSVEGSGRDTGFTRDANGNQKHNLSYNINETGHEATLINNGQYTITANTDVPNYIIRNHFKYGQEEIKYINLGLYEREQPDIAVVKDLHNVKLTINGYEHTYLYSQRFLNEGEYGDGFNVGVKFSNKYADMSYSRAIYKADYEYINENNKDKELKVYVTYQITMRNQSSNLVAQVNSLADYYDNKYQVVKVGKVLNKDGSIQENTLVEHKESEYNSEYNKTIIQNNTKIEAQKQENVYVQFLLNREAVINILNGKENLKNVVEINSYSIYDKDKIYAGIDTDSNPGNCIPGDTKTYEDDTDSSPSLILEVADAREMAGKVFLDATEDKLMTGKIRQGSGAYEEGEKGIEGVEVTLRENSGSGKVYTTTTNANGDFHFSEYIPGDYTITYTWGNETYTVQDYKGTIYDISRDQNNKNWYKENVEKRLNDALDNYETRQKIDEEWKNVTNSTQATITKMDSTTPTMGIGVEYETTYTASMGDKYVYEVKNIDFGIVERARQDLALGKRVKTVKITLANGQVVTNFTIEEDEKGNRTLVGDRGNVTYMGPDKNTEKGNGFVRVELDNEVIQGAKLQVGYEIKAINQSELDYLSKDYYLYGKIVGEIVTIEPTGVIDYLDKDWAFDANENPQWAIKTIEELKELVSKESYNVDETTIANKTILYTESLKGKKLQPTQTAEVMLNVAKTLTTTDEISLDNETEVVELTKTGGAKPESTPGNYKPGNGKTETDDNMAETIIVTPATGENQNWLIPVMIGTIALITLGVGIVIIKKKAI